MYNRNRDLGRPEATAPAASLSKQCESANRGSWGKGQTGNGKLAREDPNSGGTRAPGSYDALGLNTEARGVYFEKTLLPIIRGAKEGNQVEIEDFFRRYATPILCYFKALGIVHEEAKDLTIGVFIKVMDGSLLDGFELGRPFRRFLIRALRNRAIDYWRRKGAVKRALGERLASLDAILEAAPNLAPSFDLTPEDALIHQYYRQLHENAVASLRTRCRQEARRTKGSNCRFRFTMFRLRYLEILHYRWPRIHQMMARTCKTSATVDQLKGYVATAVRWYKNALMDQLMADGFAQAEAKAEARRMIDFLGEYRAKARRAGYGP